MCCLVCDARERRTGAPRTTSRQQDTGTTILLLTRDQGAISSKREAGLELDRPERVPSVRCWGGLGRAVVELNLDSMRLGGDC